jgi:anti-sigma B factor antagonist
MAVQITRRCVDDIPILDLAGRFVVSKDPDGTLLRAPVVKLVSEGRVNVLVHLSRVTDIDAHGLGELAWGVTMLRRTGGQMALVAPCLSVRRLLALTRLDTILPVYDSEFDALTHQRSGREHRSGGECRLLSRREQIEACQPKLSLTSLVRLRAKRDGGQPSLA